MAVDIHEVVMKLIGDIEPYADTSIDNKRNENMGEFSMRASGDTIIVLAMPGGIGTSAMVSYAKKYARTLTCISVVDRR